MAVPEPAPLVDVDAVARAVARTDAVPKVTRSEFAQPRLSWPDSRRISARLRPAQTLHIYAHRQEVGMFRALFRLIVLMIVLVAVGGFFLGWWGGRAALPDSDAVATAGKSGVEQVKRAGEEISQKTAAAAKTAGEVLSDGALTTKIKAKMGLDDTVKALDLNVDTIDGVVTVTGKVRSTAERDRALALARETNGVRQVIDRIVLQPR